MSPNEWNALLLGLLAGLTLAAVAAMAIARIRIRQARDAGRREREPAMVALSRDLDAAARERIALDERTQGLDAELRAERRAREVAERRVAETAARQQEQAHAHEDKLATLQQAETRMREAFQNLARQILDEKAQTFGEQSRQQIGGLLDPLKEQLKDLRDAALAQNQQIQSLREHTRQIGQDAINLTRALKGDSRTQGAWGELVLERVLEMSGLGEGREYDLQTVFQDEDGGRPRPDVIVHLPDDKDLVIDAKVSLTAYERAVAAPDDAERAGALREHGASLRRHIDGLSRRDYSGLKHLRTLDFVLMFVPVEAAFIEAIRSDDGLYGYALAKNIALVSPSTLLATLRTVSHLWKLEDRNLNAQEIARQAGALHDGFVMMEQELTTVGEQIEKALRTHEGAVKRIGTGKGNLIRRIENLRKLGADARKRLPAQKLEAAAADEDEDPSGSEDEPA